MSNEPANFICTTCGAQYPASNTPPAECRICTDERQYVNPRGQQWTTLAALRAEHRNSVKQLEPNLIAIGTEPKFAIGQRPLLIQTAEGNILWDCMSYLDEATVQLVRALGGISAIAISHPHFYSSMVGWSRAFDNAPIYLHRSNEQWVVRPDPAIVFWESDTHPLPGEVTLIRCGGHFPGSTVLHWPTGAEGKGVLCTGDTIQVVADRRYVTFMYSYPNQIPLPASAVRQIIEAISPFSFDRLYGGWFETVIPSEAKRAVIRSADRYIQTLFEDRIIY